MTKLSVNINKIATLRNSRGGNEPNLIEFAHKIVAFGAQGITVHPRADRRHITPEDARAVVKEITTVETNFEGDIREEFIDLVLECKPTQCTLVPVKPGEVTSNHGWEVKRWSFLLAPTISRLKKEGIRVSLFVESGDLESIIAAAELGADRIEIYTEPFAAAFGNTSEKIEVDKIIQTGLIAAKYNIGVNAGHDLTHKNLPLLIKSLPHLQEVSIGHHLICHALNVGMEKAVQDYLMACGVTPILRK